MRDQKDIKLQKNNDNRNWSDLEWVEEFFYYLQGEIPENIELSDESKLKLTPQQANAVIWYLQEHFSVFPDSIEMCSGCNGLYDSHCEGHYSELEQQCYCSTCSHMCSTTDCCDCGKEIYPKENEFDLWMCDECLEKYRKENGNNPNTPELLKGE